MRTLLLLSVVFCSAVVLPTNVAHAQLPLRNSPRPDEATLRSLFSINVPAYSSPMVQPPFTAIATTSNLLWPSLTGDVVRILQPVDLHCRTYAFTHDRLWGLLPDGGLVRWMGTTMEYDAPAWILR